MENMPDRCAEEVPDSRVTDFVLRTTERYANNGTFYTPVQFIKTDAKKAVYLGEGFFGVGLRARCEDRCNAEEGERWVRWY